MSNNKKTKGAREECKSGLVPRLRFPEFRGAGEWESSAFGKIATFFNGRAYKQDELLETGKYRVLRVGNFFTNKEWYFSDLELAEDKYCDSGDLLYAWSASFGPRIWTGEKVIYHYHIWKVLAASGISKQFLFILLYNETDRMRSRSSNGLGLLHITKGSIEGWRCFIPNYAEQQKIADCLSSLDDVIAAQARKVDALKTHKKALMQQLFPREGETLPKLRFPEFREAGEWGYAPLGTLLTKSPDYGVNAAAVPYTERLPQYLRITDISDDGKYLADKKVSVDVEPTEESFLAEGDIVLARTGASVGKSYRYRKENGQFVFAGFLIRVRPNPSRLNSTYLANFLTTTQYWKWVQATSARSGQPGINSVEYGSLAIPLPAEFSEQHKIADCLSSLDEVIAAQTRKVDALKTHKKALMQQLFPSSEGASAS
jgi:type I restriction enzyme S subunit